jgi:chromosome segregation ATPase
MLGCHSIPHLVLAGFGVTGAFFVLCSGDISGSLGSANPERVLSLADRAPGRVLQSKVDTLHQQLADHSHELDQVNKELHQRTVELQVAQAKASRLTREMGAVRAAAEDPQQIEDFAAELDRRLQALDERERELDRRSQDVLRRQEEQLIALAHLRAEEALLKRHKAHRLPPAVTQTRPTPQLNRSQSRPLKRFRPGSNW